MTVVNIVAIKCRPENEAKFNKWYDEVHIPMLLKFKGLKSVARYKLANDDKNLPAYLTVSEFASKADLDAYNASPELAAAREEIKQNWPDGGWDVVSRTPYELMGTFKNGAKPSRL